MSEQGPWQRAAAWAATDGVVFAEAEVKTDRPQCDRDDNDADYLDVSRKPAVPLCRHCATATGVLTAGECWSWSDISSWWSR